MDSYVNVAGARSWRWLCSRMLHMPLLFFPHKKLSENQWWAVWLWINVYVENPCTITMHLKQNTLFPSWLLSRTCQQQLQMHCNFIATFLPLWIHTSELNTAFLNAARLCTVYLWSTELIGKHLRPVPESRFSLFVWRFHHFSKWMVLIPRSWHKCRLATLRCHWLVKAEKDSLVTIKKKNLYTAFINTVNWQMQASAGVMEEWAFADWR